MCDNCTKLDEKIARYKQLALFVTDQLTLDGIADLLKQMAAHKAALGCKQPKLS